MKHGNHCQEDRDFSCNYFLLQVTGSSSHITNEMPDFYKKCVLAFQDYLKITYKMPECYGDIVNQYIWHNHNICFNGKSLDFRHWARVGLLKVQDIVHQGKICELKIRGKLKKVSNLFFEMSILKKAFPEDWFKLLNSHEKPNFVNARLTNECEEQNIHHLLLRKPQNIYVELLKSRVTVSKSKMYWCNKFQENFEWETIFLSNFANRLLPRKIQDFNWKIFYGAIPVENRLHVMRKSDGICKLCLTDIENVEHLMVSCPALKNVWQKVQELLKVAVPDVNIITYKEIVMGYCHHGKEYDIVNMLIFICKWQIWLRRNFMVFESDLKGIDWLWNSYKTILKGQISTVLRSRFMGKRKSRDLRVLLDKLHLQLESETPISV